MILDPELIVSSANTSSMTDSRPRLEKVRGLPLDTVLNGMWEQSLAIRSVEGTELKEVELENLSTEIVIPKFGKKIVDITARKLRIPSGRSRMILLSIQMREYELDTVD